MTAVSRCAVAGVVALACMAGSAHAQVSKSAAPAKALVAAMEARQMDTIAARDPANPRRFVAALYITGTQLLVISAVYPVPELLEPKLAAGDFRGVYGDLHASGLAEGRMFIEDLEANGLLATCGKDQPFDIVFEPGGKQTVFDGNFAKQNLSSADYQARFASADEQYAKLLTLLAGVIKTGTW